MIKKVLFISICILCIQVSLYSKDKPKITARAYILYDIHEAKFLAEKNKDRAYPAASLTKLVTSLAAREILDDKKVILINESAVIDNSIESTAGLKSGDSFTLRMLLYALLVPSGNDAAYAIAEGVSGSKTKFTELMNDWKKRHNLEKSYFADAAGLSPHTKIAPSDLLKVLLLMRNDPILKDVMSQKSYTIKSNEGREISLKSRNKLFGYKGFKIYGKTGTTIPAGHCFAGYLIHKKKEYIIIIMGSKNAFEQIKKGIDKLEL